mgnify:CR=1 FL=1
MDETAEPRRVSRSHRPHVVVIGSGIAGLGAAHALAPDHHVTLVERDQRLGGHAHTIAHRDPHLGEVGLDTGFLVHNPVTYPRLVRLFDELGVACRDTRMSFSVSCRACGIEYAGTRLWRQPAVVTDPRLRRLMTELIGFLREGRFNVYGHADRVRGE